MPEPSKALQAFFARYIFDRPELVFALRSSAGASVNIDGPFASHVFDWSKRDRENEYVIQPKWARPRPNGGETNVHVHIAGVLRDKPVWVRLWYAGTDYIDHDVRICFFSSSPPTDDRGDEIFWFYAFARDELLKHPLCDRLPPRYALRKPGTVPPGPDAKLVLSETMQIG